MKLQTKCRPSRAGSGSRRTDRHIRQRESRHHVRQQEGQGRRPGRRRQSDSGGDDWQCQLSRAGTDPRDHDCRVQCVRHYDRGQRWRHQGGGRSRPGAGCAGLGDAADGRVCAARLPGQSARPVDVGLPGAAPAFDGSGATAVAADRREGASGQGQRTGDRPLHTCELGAFVPVALRHRAGPDGVDGRGHHVHLRLHTWQASRPPRSTCCRYARSASAVRATGATAQR